MTANVGFKVTVLFKGECLKVVHFILFSYYLPNLQCNVSLMCGPSTIAESLV